MPRTIWKFPLRVANEQEVVMPRDAEILCVNEQDGRIALWAEVVPERHTQVRKIMIRGTGHSIDPNIEKKYIGTVFLEGKALVFHVFERMA